jgi:hypothetical protein
MNRKNSFFLAIIIAIDILSPLKVDRTPVHEHSSEHREGFQ